MKLPVIRESYFLNIMILIFSIFVSWFCLLFGFAHLIEGITQVNKGNDPNHPIGESLTGWIIVISLCIIGILFLFIAIAAIKGILFKLKEKNK